MSVPETTLSEMIGNVLIGAHAVVEEAAAEGDGAKKRAFALTVTKLEEAQMWAERAEGSHHETV